MRRAVILALALGGSGAADAQEWTGIWAAEPDWCRFADRIGVASPAPIRITATVSDGLENSCDIAKTKRLGTMTVWHQRLSCMGEGVAYETERLLHLSGPDVLWIFGDGGEPVRFTRCQRSKE